MNQTFANDVLEGLSASPKSLSSRYFYNEKGDEIFQKIMEMPTYYLTRSEHEILEKEKEAILEIFSKNGQPFQLIEFGAGDGTKTKVLLQHFLEKEAQFRYIPIDISQNVLDLLAASLKANFPKLNVMPQQGEYFEALRGLGNGGKTKKVILFLGANIGNFTIEEAEKFLKTMRQNLNKGDLLFIGFDLKKDPELILQAYNDQEGISKSFNLNLLQRINNELGADFDLSSFSHFPTYHPITGEMKSFLISRRAQSVYIGTFKKSFFFEAWEPIDMEISQKYDLQEINALAQKSGFRLIRSFFDSKRYFIDAAWEVK